MDILLIFGGKSVEHEVSIKTAAFIKAGLLGLGHNVKDIYITKEGLFTYEGKAVSITPPKGFYVDGVQLKADCAFIAMHGATGEDGKIQGLLELLNLPYISTDSTSSMIGMHKALQYKTLSAIPYLPYLCYSYQEKIDYQHIIEKLGDNLILKPEAGGSSVGIIHLEKGNAKEVEESINKIFTLDDKVIIQPYLTSFKELMVGVYKVDNKIKAIGPGLMDCKLDILNYNCKYTKNDIAIFNPNPELDDEIITKVKEYAIEIFKQLGCSFYSRIDFFLTDGKIYFNEINTIPGFTQTSYFPLLLKTDIGLDKFLTLMIEESFKEFKRRSEINHG